MSLTFIYDLVVKKEWQEAYKVLENCNKKNVDLVHAKIIDLGNPVEEYKIAFLFAEIYLNNEKYDEFIMYLEQFYLISSANINCGIMVTPESKKLKLQMIDNFFKMTFSDELADFACKLFNKIWMCQKKLNYPIGKSKKKLFKKLIRSIFILYFFRSPTIFQ